LHSGLAGSAAAAQYQVCDDDDAAAAAAAAADGSLSEVDENLGKHRKKGVSVGETVCCCCCC
jgi:hypothetical protein